MYQEENPYKEENPLGGILTMAYGVGFTRHMFHSVVVVQWNFVKRVASYHLIFTFLLLQRKQ